MGSPGSAPFTASPVKLSSPVKLQEASVIQDAKLPGDYGFDPLGLGTEETIVPFREAELKHARLAMLAAVAWPLQEIFHPILVDALRTSGWMNTYDMMAETNGRSPSLLNGGLEQWETAPVLMLAIFCASTLELTDLKTRQADGLAWNEYRNIARSLSPSQQREFQEKELLNGRLAMIAVTSYVAIEFAFNTPIVRFTPDLFRPLILAPDFRAFMDTAFTAASMDGSIDGIAY